MGCRSVVVVIFTNNLGFGILTTLVRCIATDVERNLMIVDSLTLLVLNRFKSNSKSYFS